MTAEYHRSILIWGATGPPQTTVIVFDEAGLAARPGPAWPGLLFHPSRPLVGGMRCVQGGAVSVLLLGSVCCCSCSSCCCGTFRMDRWRMDV